MPADIRHLYTKGRLTPDDAKALGIPAMTCIDCKTPVLLFTQFEPIPEEELASRVLPPLVWGKDVAVICPRCSFPEQTEQAE